MRVVWSDRQDFAYRHLAKVFGLEAMIVEYEYCFSKAVFVTPKLVSLCKQIDWFGSRCAEVQVKKMC